MIEVKLNLENEHVLSNNLNTMLDKLPQKKLEEIAEKVLFKYLTDTVDHEKQTFIENSLKEVREEGLKCGSSYYSKTIEEISGMSDEGIKNLAGFREKYTGKYKSSKESRLTEIQSTIDTVLKEKITTFVKDNEDLANLLVEKQTNIVQNFHELVNNTMSSLVNTLIMSTIQQAQFGQANFDTLNNITDVLNRHNIN